MKNKTKQILPLFELQQLHGELFNSLNKVIEDAKILLATLCKLRIDCANLYTSIQTEPIHEPVAEFYNSDEAAEYLKIKKSTVWKLYEERKLEGGKPNGKLLVFSKAQLDSYLNRNSNCTKGEMEEEATMHLSKLKFNSRKK